MKTEFGWLIEKQNFGGSAEWLRVMLDGDSSAHLVWTGDANLALRFTHREFARQFALLHKDFCVLVILTEHGFDVGE